MVLVRKWMKQTREEYDDVFRETERNGQIYPTWKSNKPCRPTIQRKDKTKKSPREVSSQMLDRAEGPCQETRTDNSEVRHESLVQTEFLNGAGTIPNDVGRKDEVEIKSQRFQSLEDKFLTVETQTSFCEPSASIQEKHITEQCVQTENQTTKQLTLTPEPILTSYETETSMTHEETKVLSKEGLHTVPLTKIDVSENETKNTVVKECLTPKQGTKLASKGISYIGKTPDTSSSKISPSREIPAPTPKGSHGCFSNETSVWDSFYNVTGIRCFQFYLYLYYKVISNKMTYLQ